MLKPMLPVVVHTVHYAMFFAQPIGVRWDMTVSPLKYVTPSSNCPVSSPGRLCGQQSISGHRAAHTVAYLPLSRASTPLSHNHNDLYGIKVTSLLCEKFDNYVRSLTTKCIIQTHLKLLLDWHHDFKLVFGCSYSCSKVEISVCLFNLWFMGNNIWFCEKFILKFCLFNWNFALFA